MAKPTFEEIMEIDAFRNWLQEKQPDEVVGKAESGDSCPVANYLKARCAQEASQRLWVHADEIQLGVEDYFTPGWARDFIDQVDEKGMHVEITADNALRILGGG